MGAVQGWERFTARGAMNYPEGEMKFPWDGLGTRGRTATCQFTEEAVRITLSKWVRFGGWPELVLPREEIEVVERMFVGYRFRCIDPLLDGACFTPIGSRDRFLAGLKALRIPVVQVDWREKLRFEGRVFWNASHRGGRPLWRKRERTTD